MVESQKYQIVRCQYDDILFGKEVYELRECEDVSNYYQDDHALIDRLGQIAFCTFRGSYNQRIIHLLEENEFKFIDDFIFLKIQKKKFSKLFKKNRISIDVITGPPNQETINNINDIQQSVNEFSTFQQDKRLPNEITSRRNLIKIQSLFTKENYIGFLVKNEEEKRYVAFLQFLIFDDHVIAQNGAVDPIFQNLFVGAALYSYAFEYIFTNMNNIKNISVTFGLNNARVMNMLLEMGGKIEGREVHLRKIK
jgi:ribosomal protein S18 acetylase RimI-like enzyme